jgi:hypothetical protein
MQSGLGHEGLKGVVSTGFISLYSGRKKKNKFMFPGHTSVGANRWTALPTVAALQ